jgi:hypothetical protein
LRLTRQKIFLFIDPWQSTGIVLVKHKKGKDNVVADALSWKNILLTQLDIKVPSLENLCDLYATDHDFSAPYSMCTSGKAWDKYHIHDGFLFHANKLCVSRIVCVFAIVAGITCRQFDVSLWA